VSVIFFWGLLADIVNLLMDVTDAFFWLSAEVLDVPALFFLPLLTFLLAFEGVSRFPLPFSVFVLDRLDD